MNPIAKPLYLGRVPPVRDKNEFILTGLRRVTKDTFACNGVPALTGLALAFAVEAHFMVDADVQQQTKAEHDGQHGGAAVGDQW